MAVDYDEGKKRYDAWQHAKDISEDWYINDRAEGGRQRADAAALAKKHWNDWCDAYAEALLNPDPWRPIEEAPKDGTVILLANGQDTAPGKWAHGDWRAMYFVIDGASDFRAGAGLFQSPTHFRELKGPGQ